MRKKYNEIASSARCKLNSIENIITKALTDNEITHEEFATITNK